MTEVFSRYQEEQKKHFNISLNMLLSLVTFEENVSNIVYGPKYHVNIQKGLPLVISTYSFDESRPYTRAKDWALAVIAQEEETGEIVGLRANLLFGNDLSQLLTADGQISIGKRGFGIASPLNLVFIDLLQRISNEGRPIHWSIENGNLIQLESYRKKLGESQNPDDLRLLGLLEEEQQRWLSMYGVDGTLGFRRYKNYEFEYYRDFVPEPGAQNVGIGTTDLVHFQPRLADENGRHIYHLDITEEIPVMNMEAHRESREDELRFTIGPIIVKRASK